jgi:hypothetical protein
MQQVPLLVTRFLGERRADGRINDRDHDGFQQDVAAYIRELGWSLTAIAGDGAFDLAELCRRKVETLQQALNSDDTRSEATEILRGLIDAIHVRPWI